MQALPENWTVFESAELVAQALAETLLELAEKAIAARGKFLLVTAGGTTPQRCYEILSTREADWQNWHIYMGDERCLPVEDKDRNSVSLKQAWLFFGKIPSDNIHLIPTELGPELAADAYQKLLANVIRFDVVLLGMGEDGHTASLFPGHAYSGGKAVVIERDSPKPPSERVSLSFQALSQSRYVFKLITGKNKRDAVHQWLSGESLPIQKVTGDQTMVWLDESAL